MKTSLIIPNWRGRKLLEKNLPKALKVGFDELIVVDDASPDGSVEFLKKNFQGIKVLQHSKNKGFAQTVNDGVNAATGDIIFLLNIDVVPEADLVEHTLKHFAQDNSVFGVSLHEKGFGWALPSMNKGFVAHKPGKETSSPHITFWVSGGSGAFRKSLWNKLGGLDTMLSPFYWEDLELGYRAWKRGWKLVWEPKALVLHQHESVINPAFFNARFLQWIKDRNQLLVTWKHFTLKELVFSHFPALARRLTKPGYWIVLFLALLRLPQVAKGRIIERREVKLSNEEIFEIFSKG